MELIGNLKKIILEIIVKETEIFSIKLLYRDALGLIDQP